mmetsp:Transcript_70213/g.186575  ORF Transcript_70213/g.186575 Transcript_70213/m.186575 type:complete len:103 (+) Transcript_70213:196-504(+)
MRSSEVMETSAIGFSAPCCGDMNMAPAGLGGSDDPLIDLAAAVGEGAATMPGTTADVEPTTPDIPKGEHAGKEPAEGESCHPVAAVPEMLRSSSSGCMLCGA